MQIDRPPSGFKIVEHAVVRQFLFDYNSRCPWLAIAYANVIELLRMAAHRIGSPIKGNAAQRVFIESDPATGQTRLAVAYEVTADTVTVRALKIVIPRE